jgi:hypothetical protein
MPELHRPSAPRPGADAWRHAPGLAALSLLGVALCWLIVSHSVAGWLSRTSPKSALLLRGNDPGSLLALVDKEINFDAGDPSKTPGPSQPTAQRLKQLRDLAETALINEPLSSPAYRLLGQIADRQGFAEKAETLMRAAARADLHESASVHWMMWKSFERKDYPAAAYYADALLRSGRGAAITRDAIPILARMAEDPAAKQEIKKLLAANPSWRSWFLGALGPYIRDARTPLDLFLSLKDTRAPPTTEELNAYQWFLVRHKLHELAYYVWLQFLPPEKLEAAGFLFNGDFEARPSGSPFDWQAAAGVNVIVDFAPRLENPSDHALVVEFGPGLVEFPGVSQSIVLAPGAYLLRGSVNGEVLGRRGVDWGVSCVDGTSLGQSEMIAGTFPIWRAFEFAFVVPETGCSTQLVQLKLDARSPSEQLVSGAIWFDELAISHSEKKLPK